MDDFKLDTRDWRQEYIDRMNIVINQAIGDYIEDFLLDRKLDIIELTRKCAADCYDISQMDFGDNYNPNHGTESR